MLSTKYKLLNNISKDLSIIIIGRVLQIIIMLVSFRLLTTFLTPEEVGNYYIILALVAFFNLVLLNPSGMYFNRHLLQWQRSKNLLNALFVFILWIVIVAIASIPISIFVYGWLGYATKFGLDLFLIYIFTAILISTIHRNVMYGTNTLGYRKEFVMYLISTLLIGLICSVSIIHLYHSLALSWLMGIILSEALMLHLIFKFFIQKNKLNIQKIKITLNKDKVQKILIFSLPIALTTFLMWGQNTAYRFLVDYQYSAEVLGYLGIGLGISGSIFASIEAISMQYFNPIFLKNILDSSKKKRTEAWNSMAKQIVPIYILASFFTIAMSEVLISIVASEKFHDSYVYIMFGVVIEFFRVMTNLLNNVSQSEYKTTETIKPYLVGFVISLGLLSNIDFGTNYFMIPLVLGLSYFLVFIYMYSNMKKMLDIKYDVNILKTILFSLPFLMVYFINVTDINLVLNLLVVSTFGLYFLFVVWLFHHQSVRTNTTYERE
jgi:O-antigen/teichoic acid export membrane protein